MKLINFRKVLVSSLVTFFAIGLLLWFGGRAWIAAGVMPYEGRHVLAGLDGEVEILFDGRGIPRVYTSTDQDAYRALGWLHAGERLFQLELTRRATRGTLSEIFGSITLEADRVHRLYDFAGRVDGRASDLDSRRLGVLEAYVEGINSRLENTSRLPPEFLLMQLTPEPWSVEDVLAIGYYQTWYPSSLVSRLAETRRDLVEKFGPDAADWLTGPIDWSVPSTGAIDGSNSWVVAPKRSESSGALHASDPHLDHTVVPGHWYAAGLHSDEGLDVVGVTAPGLPLFAMGHNGQSAWSFTVAPVDTFEFYRQQRHPEDPDLALGPNGWQPVERHTGQIAVSDQEGPVEVEFIQTELGRVIETTESQWLVKHWAGFDLDPIRALASALEWPRIDNFQDFRDTATDTGALSVNLLYSDRDGDIGYVQTSPIPNRQHTRFFEILDGSDPENVWDGFHPPPLHPHAHNPDRGWLGSANNRPAGEDWPIAIPGSWKELRKRRLSAWLDGDGSFNTEAMRAMQLDRVSDRALSWKGWLIEIAQESGRDALADELDAWDGSMDPESTTAALFARWWGHLGYTLFEGTGLPVGLVNEVVDEWMHGGHESIEELQVDREAAGKQALDRALGHETARLGAIQQLEIRHPMAGAGLLDAWLGLSRGPFPVGGDEGSLNVTGSRFEPHGGRLEPRYGPSMRFVMDWADPDAFTLNLLAGQSGHPSSPHFDDFIDDYLSGTPWSVPWSREAAERGTESRLELVP